MRVGSFTIGGAPAGRLPYFIERSRRRAVWAPEAAGLDDGCWFWRRRRLVWVTEAFINRTVPDAFLICQSSAVRPSPSGAEGAYSKCRRPLICTFDRAFVAFLQKARSPATFASRFRPCLCRFFAKGTVACAPQPPISTVPLTIFCKRHGRLHPTTSDFDRAFDVFLQKARSAMPSAPHF